LELLSLFYHLFERKPIVGTIPSITSNEILHIGEFGLFSMLLMFGFHPKVKYYILILISMLYAVSDEIHQYFVPTRYFAVLDIIHDCVGVILGVIIFFMLITIKKWTKSAWNIYCMSLNHNIKED